MSNRDDFADFLSGQQQKVDEGKEFEQEFRTNFPKSVITLYDEIEKWLKPYIQQGQISIREDNNNTSTEFYNLIINVAGKDVHFIPEQQVFLGSRGIVRVKSSSGKQKSLRQPEWNTWIVSSPNEKRTGHVENVIPPKAPTYLNEQTLKEVLKELTS